VDNQRASLLLLVAAVPVFLVALGANSIWDANEAFYVETPRQMVLSGDYVNPSFSGEPRFNKPVLSYWLVAGAYRLLGESVAVERLVIAFAAIGTLVATVAVGRAAGSGLTGVIAALLLATAPRFVFFSRRILIDVLVTMCMTAALACFATAERWPERRRWYLWLMYLAIGCGVLTKGPVALVLPAAAIFLWLASERKLADITSLQILPGLLIVAAVVLPWYALIYRAHGWEYIRHFFIDENLGRLQSPLTTARSADFFVRVLLGDILLPWAPLVAVPLLTSWRREPEEAPGAPMRRLLWWWVVVIVVAFSFSASKEDLYILPAIPAAAVLIADILLRTAWGEAHRGVSYVLVAIAVLCLAMAGVVYEWFTEGPYAVAGALSMAILLALTGALTFVSLWRRMFSAACLTLASGFILFNYLFVATALPDLERLKPVPALASVINDRGGPAASLGFFNMDLPSFVYYTRRPAEKIGDIDAAQRFLADREDGWLVTTTFDWSVLRVRVPGSCVAGRRPLFVAKASDILIGQSPPDVVLVTRGRGCVQ